MKKIISTQRLLICGLLSMCCTFSEISLGKNTPVKLSLQVFSNSRRVDRGIILWDRPIIMPAVGLILFESLHFRGPNIFYSPFGRKDIYKLNVGFKYFDDREPWIKWGTPKRQYHDLRSSSSYLYVEAGRRFGFMKLFSLSLKLEREIYRYKGWLGSISFKVPVAPYTSLKSTLGAAEKNGNVYYYGEGALGGLGFYSLGLSYFYNKSSWLKKISGKIILSAKYQKLLSRQERAQLLRQSRDQWSLSFRFMMPLYP